MISWIAMVGGLAFGKVDQTRGLFERMLERNVNTMECYDNRVYIKRKLG